VHSRFSTNTFPSWDRAPPYRYIAHNGEINTLRGNINWMRAREAQLESSLFGDDISKIAPIVNVNGSDSSMFDNVLELMVLAGRPLAHAMMMMIPEPWSKHETMDPARRAFYQFHSSLMEPWDGPAAICFTDGVRMGAVLDRNGLRPGRYWVTKDGMVVAASETGVLDIPPADIVRKGRLQPGHMFMVDTEQGRIIDDEEIKRSVVQEWPYAEWLGEHLVHLKELPAAPQLPPPEPELLRARQVAFGYTFEDLRILMAPMARGLDGQRYAARGAVAAFAPALRLLQAALRAGHEPAHRQHPRGDHHLVRRLARPHGQSARAATDRLPPRRAQGAGAHERRVRKGPAPVVARSEGRDALAIVPRRPRR
jgi:glutamate synthase (ferredoxin)